MKGRHVPMPPWGWRHEAQVSYIWMVMLTGSSWGWRYLKRTPRGWLQMIRRRAMEDRHNPKAGIGGRYAPVSFPEEGGRNRRREWRY